VDIFTGSANGYAPSGDTVIGNDVWIGSEAIIMPGVKIGHGSIIGTRALVTRDVEPYAIVGGNPARTIRPRFDENSVNMLLEMQWWDWTDHQLKGAMQTLTNGDVEALYRYWQSNVCDQ
jgi:chloramphenicol O-acetyltransferase type B